MKRHSLSIISVLILVSLLFGIAGCGQEISESLPEQLKIINYDGGTLDVGDELWLVTNIPTNMEDDLKWSSSDDSVSVDPSGKITAVKPGKAIITVKLGRLFARVQVTVAMDYSTDLPEILAISPERDRFYGDADPADSYEEALARSEQGILSGALTVPDQSPVISSHQPKKDGLFIRNSKPYFADENTYVVVDAYGSEVFRVYRGGGYITLEEVAAYVYAFGDIPANYTGNKKADPTTNIWGEHLRLNHTQFSGNTSKYPYEPELPDISGCGGSLKYYEIDIGTTGTDCDPSYSAVLYNDGRRIVRGAARIVYSRFDANGNQMIDPNEKYVFYTYNHYNDFQEYLNYFGGWGEIFGNITGGGKISDKYNCNPTPYVETVLSELPTKAKAIGILWILPVREDERLAA